ncbi:MAG: DUF4293 domain-containing protein [Bacteroidales bacterium]|nr:DUF4293 domain-containing protein [Bacteroidales bacterium]
MIQRIQSVYLFLASVLLAGLYFLPVAEFLGDFGYYKLFITHLESLTPDAEQFFGNMFFYPSAILNAVVIGIGIITIFKYKNRKLQMKLVNLNVFLTIVSLMGILFYYVPAVEKATSIKADYVSELGLYLPLLSLALFVLALKAIRKDERLVRSEDRIR